MPTLLDLIMNIDSKTEGAAWPEPPNILNSNPITIPNIEINGYLVDASVWCDDAGGGEGEPVEARRWYARLQIRSPYVVFDKSGIWEDYTVGEDTIVGVRTLLGDLGALLENIGVEIIEALDR